MVHSMLCAEGKALALHVPLLLSLLLLLLQRYVRQNSWPFWLAWGIAIALLLVLACVEKARRQHPVNMILLAAFTCAQAFLVGMISAYYNIEVWMHGVGGVLLR